MSEVTASLHGAIKLLVGLYLALLFAIGGVVSYLTSVHQNALADTVVLSVRNSILIGENRQAISVANTSIGRSFDAVIYSREDGELVFALPNPTVAEQVGASVFEGRIQRDIKSDITNGNQPPPVFGRLTFYFDYAGPISLAFQLWAIFLVTAVPLFVKMKRTIERRYQEQLTIREAQIASVITRQVSHDIRSPVSALKVVLSRLEGIPADQMEMLTQVAARINGIANDLLQRGSPTSRPNGLDSNDQLGSLSSGNEAEFEPARVLTSIFKEKLAVLGSGSKVKLVLDINGDESAKCKGSPEILSRVLSNLINNAYEAIESSGIVRLAFRSTTNEVSLFVQDNGKGIPSELVGKLGRERFSFGKDGQESGSGLGLLHARTSIEAMNGTLVIQSSLGHGSLIQVRLPRL